MGANAGARAVDESLGARMSSALKKKKNRCGWVENRFIKCSSLQMGKGVHAMVK